MAEPERTTSFAKSVKGLHHEESALDRARALRDQFAHVQEQSNEKQKSRQTEKPRETEQVGSQMVRNDKPLLQPTPRGNMRQAPDRFAAYRKLQREHKNAGTSFEEKAARHVEQQKAAPKPAHDLAAAANAHAANEQVKKAAAEKAYKAFQERQQQIHNQERPHDRDRER